MLAGNDLTDQAFSLLAPVLSAPAAAGLLQLDLGRNKLTASSMQRAQLNRLVLSGNEGVGDTGMALLVAAMV
ncbi:hypothetical protein HaLaN_21416, partial [Haematococcus lacustris]